MLEGGKLYLIGLMNGTMDIGRYTEAAAAFDFLEPGFDCGDRVVNLPAVKGFFLPVEEDELRAINAVTALINMVTGKPSGGDPWE
jgi:hypothetical protein